VPPLRWSLYRFVSGYFLITPFCSPPAIRGVFSKHGTLLHSPASAPRYWICLCSCPSITPFYKSTFLPALLVAFPCLPRCCLMYVLRCMFAIRHVPSYYLFGHRVSWTHPGFCGQFTTQLLPSHFAFTLNSSFSLLRQLSSSFSCASVRARVASRRKILWYVKVLASIFCAHRGLNSLVHASTLRNPRATEPLFLLLSAVRVLVFSFTLAHCSENRLVWVCIAHVFFFFILRIVCLLG